MGYYELKSSSLSLTTTIPVTPTRNKHNRTTVELHRPLSRSRFETATTTILAVMLVWVNEKAIFCSDFSRVVFDGLL